MPNNVVDCLSNSTDATQRSVIAREWRAHSPSTRHSPVDESSLGRLSIVSADQGTNDCCLQSDSFIAKIDSISKALLEASEQEFAC